MGSTGEITEISIDDDESQDPILVDDDEEMEDEEEEQEYYICAFDNCSFSTLVQQELYDHAESLHLKPKSSVSDTPSLVSNAELSHKSAESSPVKTYEKYHQCTQCEFKSTLRLELSNHVKRQHEKLSSKEDDTEITIDDESCDNVVKCWYDEFCSFETPNEEKMGAHVKTAHLDVVTPPKVPENNPVEITNDAPIPMQEKFQSTISDSDESLSEITSPSSQAPDVNLECKHCKQKFLVQHSLDRHIKKNHSGLNNLRQQAAEILSKKQIFKPTTTATVKTNSNGLLTIQDINANITRTTKTMVQCPYCKFKNEEKANVKNHIRTMHMNELAKNLKRISCPVDAKCVYQTIYDNNMKLHVRNHHMNMGGKGLSSMIYKGNKIPCSYDPLCRFTTNDKRGLKRHISNVHKKEYKFPCNRCDQKFTSSYHLKRHQERMHSSQTNIGTSGVVIEQVQQGSNNGLQQGSNQQSNYPFDFEFLKNFLKVYESVKHVVDTTHDLDLRDEILAKDTHDLLGHRRRNPDFMPATNETTAEEDSQPVSARDESTGFIGNENDNLNHLLQSDEQEENESGNILSKISSDMFPEMIGIDEEDKDINAFNQSPSSSISRVHKKMMLKERRASLEEQVQH